MTELRYIIECTYVLKKLSHLTNIYGIHYLFVYNHFIFKNFLDVIVTKFLLHQHKYTGNLDLKYVPVNRNGQSRLLKIHIVMAKVVTAESQPLKNRSVLFATGMGVSWLLMRNASKLCWTGSVTLLGASFYIFRFF